MIEQNNITYHLEPGFVYVSSERAVIRTVVGSCIAVCLWDETQQIGGMNHYLYPETTQQGKTTTQYGNIAIPVLISILGKCGCQQKHLVAHIYGGSRMHETSGDSVGDKNSSIAHTILKENKIHILSEETGGKIGRKIIFDTASGCVVVFKVNKLNHDEHPKQIE